ncbi:unnamed protein product [Sympodiomycopsis kandeliae]
MLFQSFSIAARRLNIVSTHLSPHRHLRAAMSTTTATHKDGSTNWSSNDGHFRRQESGYRETISTDSIHKPEVGRYHLMVAHACPWAHRAMIVRKLKGIDQVENLLPLHVVDSILGPEGWSFQPYGLTHPDLKGLGIPGTGKVPGHENKLRIKDFYLASNPNHDQRSTVPIIWDEKLQKVVNNESSEIIRILNTAFDEFIPEQYKNVTYYPDHLKSEIDELNEWVYTTVNNGVYKSGFATTTAAYEENVFPLFKSLDRLESILSKKQNNHPEFIIGDQLTEADIRLYTTLIRFDPVYVGHFKCNINTIRHGYPLLNKWLKNLYWNHPAFKDTTHFDSIKSHYYQSHPNINPTRIVPAGPVPHIEDL